MNMRNNQTHSRPAGSGNFLLCLQVSFHHYPTFLSKRSQQWLWLPLPKQRMELAIEQDSQVMFETTPDQKPGTCKCIATVLAPWTKAHHQNPPGPWLHWGRAKISKIFLRAGTSSCLGNFWFCYVILCSELPAKLSCPLHSLTLQNKD